MTLSTSVQDAETRLQHALDLGYRYLGHRDRTVLEMRRHLEAKRVEPATIDDALAELARHPAADIVVVGHTDALGSDATNDALALKRAQTVRASILGRGIAADSVSAVGRGKRELLVPTPDGVAEPRNRRVEILVR